MGAQTDLIADYYDFDAERELRARWIASLRAAVSSGAIDAPPRAAEIAAAGGDDDAARWRAYLDLRGRVQVELRGACVEGDLACYRDFSASLQDRAAALLRDPRQQQAAREIAAALEKATGRLNQPSPKAATVKQRASASTTGAAASAGAGARAQLLAQLDDAQRKCDANRQVNVLEALSPLTWAYNEVTGKDEDADAAFWCARVQSIRTEIAALDAKAAPPPAPGAPAPTPPAPGGGWGVFSPAPAPAPAPAPGAPSTPAAPLGLLDRAYNWLFGPPTTAPTGIVGVVDAWFQDARQTALAVLVALVVLGGAWVYYAGKTAQIIVPAIAPHAATAFSAAAPVVPQVVELFTSKPVNAVSSAVSDVAQVFQRSPQVLPPLRRLP
jgi:hypothetical protein